MAIPTKTNWRPVHRRTLAVSLSLLLFAASLSKLWAGTRFPQPPRHSWIESPSVSEGGAICEAALAVVLLAGLRPRQTWLVAVSIFSLFATTTALETLQGKDSCGCFGAVLVRPIYTMSLDLAAVALLLITGRPKAERQNSEGRRQNAEAGRGRWLIASTIGTAWVGIVTGMWLTRPVIAVATAATLGQVVGKPGQTFGNPGELVVLEPEKWIGQHFSLADHIDIGSQLNSGQWIILLVHHDCDHCAAAVPRYVSASLSAGDTPRLAIIEMPPFTEPTDPPPWQLPPSVLTGRLDESRDWFATTPVALRLREGIVISAKESDAAETPFSNTPMTSRAD